MPVTVDTEGRPCHSFSKCAERTLLEEFMTTASIGQLLTYQALAIACRLTVEEVQSTRRYILAGAVKALEDDGVFFLCEANAGMRRVSDEVYLDKAVPDRLDRARRLNRRNRSALKAMDYDTLGERQRETWNKQATICAVLDSVTSRRQQRAIGTACARAGKELETKSSVLAFLQTEA